MPEKIVKLVHLVGFIVKKFVTMHGDTNVKKKEFFSRLFKMVVGRPNIKDY
jgi:hypothetical protein